MKEPFTCTIPISLLIALAGVIPFVSNAVLSISPGQTYQFQQADGGGTECRVATGGLPDTTPCGAKTKFDTSRNFVQANFDESLVVGGLGEAHYSTAWIYNDFSIPGNPSQIVDA